MEQSSCFMHLKEKQADVALAGRASR